MFTNFLQNSTDDLEVRVTLLENDVTALQDEVEEVETDNTLQDERLNTMEEAVIANVNEIDGNTVFLDSNSIFCCVNVSIMAN